eukprot:gene13086-biopygen11637
MRGLYSVACPVSVLGGGRAWIAPKLPLPSVALDSQNGSAAAAWVGGDVFTMYNVVAMEMTQLPMGLLWLWLLLVVVAAAGAAGAARRGRRGGTGGGCCCGRAPLSLSRKRDASLSQEMLPGHDTRT